MQTRDAVVFFSESLHDAWIFRLSGTHPPAAVGSFGGASIARWEGDSLVVETRNFAADQNRAGETQYLRSKEAIFEDACHEGNYSLRHILEGGRVRDGTLR